MFETVLARNLQAGVIIIAIILISLLLGKRLSVKTRFFLWFLPIIRLLMPNLPPFRFAVFQPSETLADQFFIANTSSVTSIVPDKIAGAPTHMSLAPTFAEMYVMLWLAGIAIFLGYMIISNIIFYLKIRKIEIHNGVGITDLTTSPVTVGLFRTKILLSSHNILDDAQKELVIAHEKVHIKRKDLWLYLFLNILCCVYWFNPLIWYLSIKIKQDAELLCDGEVLKNVTDEQKQLYGSTIIDMLRSSCHTPNLRTAAGIIGSKQHMKSRIKMIASFSKKSYKFSVLGIVILLLAGCVSLTNNVSVNGRLAPSPTTVPDFVQERYLEYSYSFQDMEYSDKLLTSGQKGKFDLFKVLKILNISYEVKDREITIAGLRPLDPAVSMVDLKNEFVFPLPNEVDTIKVTLENNTAYVDETEVLNLLRNAKSLNPYNIDIDEKNKKVSATNMLVSHYPANAQIFDITYELGNSVNLIYDKERSTLIIGTYSMPLDGAFIDGRITIANRLPENDDMAVELWDGETVTTIPLKISEVVK